VTGDLSRGWLDGVDWVRMLDQTDDLVLRVEPSGEGRTTWIGHVDEEFVGLRYGTRIGFGDEVVEHIGIAVDRDDATVHPVPVEASPFEDDRDDWDYEELTHEETVSILRAYAFESPVDGTRRTALDHDDIVWGVFDGEPSREDCDTLMRLAADAPKFKLRDLPDRGRCLVVDEHRTGLGPTDSRRRRIEIVRHRRRRERDPDDRDGNGDPITDGDEKAETDGGVTLGESVETNLGPRERAVTEVAVGDRVEVSWIGDETPAADGDRTEVVGEVTDESVSEVSDHRTSVVIETDSDDASDVIVDRKDTVRRVSDRQSLGHDASLWSIAGDTAEVSD
jgi:hypothetical protein